MNASFCAPLTGAHLFLVGPRACGKTSLARLLAARLGLPGVDTDARVVEAAGREIAAIVAAQGWGRFRDLETEALAAVCAGPVSVVATGGGIVLKPANRELLAAHGAVIYLQADADTLLARLAKAPLPGQRPALTDAPPRDEMLRVLAEREPLYQACAGLVLDATRPLAELAGAAAEFYTHFPRRTKP